MKNYPKDTSYSIQIVPLRPSEGYFSKSILSDRVLGTELRKDIPNWIKRLPQAKQHPAAPPGTKWQEDIDREENQSFRNREEAGEIGAGYNPTPKEATESFKRIPGQIANTALRTNPVTGPVMLARDVGKFVPEAYEAWGGFGGKVGEHIPPGFVEHGVGTAAGLASFFPAASGVARAVGGKIPALSGTARVLTKPLGETFGTALNTLRTKAAQGLEGLSSKVAPKTAPAATPTPPPPSQAGGFKGYTKPGAEPPGQTFTPEDRAPKFDVSPPSSKIFDPQAQGKTAGQIYRNELELRKKGLGSPEPKETGTAKIRDLRKIKEEELQFPNLPKESEPDISSKTQRTFQVADPRANIKQQLLAKEGKQEDPWYKRMAFGPRYKVKTTEPTRNPETGAIQEEPYLSDVLPHERTAVAARRAKWAGAIAGLTGLTAAGAKFTSDVKQKQAEALSKIPPEQIAQGKGPDVGPSAVDVIGRGYEGLVNLASAPSVKKIESSIQKFKEENPSYSIEGSVPYPKGPTPGIGGKPSPEETAHFAQAKAAVKEFGPRKLGALIQRPISGPSTIRSSGGKSPRTPKPSDSDQNRDILGAMGPSKR